MDEEGSFKTQRGKIHGGRLLLVLRKETDQSMTRKEQPTKHMISRALLGKSSRTSDKHVRVNKTETRRCH